MKCNEAALFVVRNYSLCSWWMRDNRFWNSIMLMLIILFAPNRMTIDFFNRNPSFLLGYVVLKYTLPCYYYVIEIHCLL